MYTIVCNNLRSCNVNDGNIVVVYCILLNAEWWIRTPHRCETVHVGHHCGDLFITATVTSTRSDPNHSWWFLKKSEDHARRGHILVSGATHQTCPRVVADLSYRTTSRRHFGLNQREIVLVSAAQSTRIRYVNFVRTSPILDHPYATGFTDPQYRHQTLSHYVRSATNQ